MTDFGLYIGATARKLFGDPNPEFTTDAELRFGTHGSVSIIIKGDKRGSWYDHQDNVGGGVLELLQHKKGLSNGEAIEWLQREVGAPKEEIKTYDYTDESGKLLFQVVRKIPKAFVQRRPDGADGWIWKMAGVRRVPYRLPALIAAIEQGKTIYVPEGEKDCDNLAALGFAATCNPGGAGKWRREYGAHLRGADVVLLPDNDDSGRKHADQVGQNLKPVARRVRVMALPALAEKGDVSDWLAAGGNAEELTRLTNDAPLWAGAAVATTTPVIGHEERPPEFTDEALALAFAAMHENRLRYVATWGKWLMWDGCRWQIDHTLHAFDLARRLCRTESIKCNKPKTSTAIASAKTVAAVERLTKADRRLAATVDQWDANIWLLNTPECVVDLQTGRSRTPKIADYTTKVTAASPGGECPRWLDFLNRITGGDGDLRLFLQRMAGYALTGSTEAHALFFGFGTGANGKGVFVNTIAGIMGDYAAVAPMEAFIASFGDRHPTELASLRGARLVTAQETEEGRRWAESRIKALTGGDRIAARFMRQDFFEFTPQFKLLIIGNHKPGLRGVDEAIRRRMNLIPFGITIPEQERDEKLPERLREEWPGILAWMIDGCLDWQGEGLAQPEAVRKATEQYLEAEDALSQWMTERCTVKAGFYATSSELFGNWKAWADQAGEYAGSQKRFSQALLARGLAPRRQGGTGKTGFDGIGLRVLA